MIHNRTSVTLHEPSSISTSMWARRILVPLSTCFGEAETSWNHGQTLESGIFIDNRHRRIFFRDAEDRVEVRADAQRELHRNSAMLQVQ